MKNFDGPCSTAYSIRRSRTVYRLYAASSVNSSERPRARSRRYTSASRHRRKLAKPALATVAIFSFVFRWNDFFGPLIYLSTPEQMTIAVGLQLFRGQWGTDFSLLMAASTVAVLPIIVLFFFAQKTFVQGIALTGVKG